MHCVPSVLRRDVATETYEDLSKMLRTIVKRFVQRYGGDYEELFAEANAIFCQAINRFDPSKGYAITTYVYCAVHKHLCSLYWRDRKHKNGCIIKSLETLTQGDDGEEIPIEQFAKACKSTDNGFSKLLADLGEDGRNIVYLLLYPPIDLLQEFNGQDTVDSQKECLKEYLQFYLKWPLSKVERIFHEMEETVTGKTERTRVAHNYRREQILRVIHCLNQTENVPAKPVETQRRRGRPRKDKV